MTTIWRHKKRGTRYEVLTDKASLQCATDEALELRFISDDWTVYRNIETGAVYIRLTKEFLDGRFEKNII